MSNIPRALSCIAITACISLPCLFAQELRPHLSGEGVRYLGEFHGNFAYLSQYDDGQWNDPLEDGSRAFSIYTFREEVGLLLYDTQQAKFCALESSELNANDFSLENLDWRSFPAGSIPHSAWAIASGSMTPTIPPKNGKLEKTWSYVSTGELENSLQTIYVGSKISSPPNTSVKAVALLFLMQDRAIVTISPDRDSYSFAPSDPMGSPLTTDRPSWRPLEPGSLGERVRKLLKN